LQIAEMKCYITQHLWKSVKTKCIFQFFLQCSDTVGWGQERHLACKNSGVGLFVVTIRLQLCTSYSSICHHHLHYPSLQ